jgi:hypothetical protein
MVLTGWYARAARRQRAAAVRHVGPLLQPGEVIEIVINGGLGTVSGNAGSARALQAASPGSYLAPAGALDPYEVVLTTTRLLALRAVPRLRGARSITLANDRQATQVAVVRRRRLYDRVQFGFVGCSLTLTVSRTLRTDVDQLISALGQN